MIPNLSDDSLSDAAGSRSAAAQTVDDECRRPLSGSGKRADARLHWLK